MSFRISFALVLAALAVIVGTGASAQSGRPRELPHVTQLGAALSEYNDGVVQAVAAYYHSQRHHDSRWLLVEFGVNSQRSLDIARDRIELVTPAGDVVPLASQRQWGQDSARARQLLQEAQPTRHQVRTYFRQIADHEPLRFFGRPEQGETVFDVVSASFDRVFVGDLLFESPTGAWARGQHVLILRLRRDVVELPIELR
jgi:hypothetical protein